MRWLPRCSRVFVFALLLVLLSFSHASAHCFVGARFLPATLVTDDPCVADEMSLPTVAWFKTGDTPPASEVDIEVDISKRIIEDFGSRSEIPGRTYASQAVRRSQASPISTRPSNINFSRTLRTSLPCS